MPALATARKQSSEVACLANIRSHLQAIQVYASDNKSALVCGSSNLLLYPGQGPWRPINSTATFQFWLGLNQEAPGLGVLVEKNLLSAGTLFCPADVEANPVGEDVKRIDRTTEIAWCSYLYRQLDAQGSVPAKTRLGSLGDNAQGRRVTALVIDAQCTLVWTGVPLKRNHQGLRCGIGFIDGSAIAVPNTNENLTLMGNTGQVEQRLNSIFEYADTLFP
jgi:hypothetical protein